MKQITLGMLVFFIVVLSLTGCTSRATEEQMSQLQTRREEAASIQREINLKKTDKATMEREIADKQAKLSQCREDAEALRKGMGK